MSLSHCVNADKYVEGTCARFFISIVLFFDRLWLLDSGLQVILTAEVSGGQGSRIFISDDFGKSFTNQELPFMPLMQITYNPENSRVLTVLSTSVSSAKVPQLPFWMVDTNFTMSECDVLLWTCQYFMICIIFMACCKGEGQTFNFLQAGSSAGQSFLDIPVVFMGCV